MTTRTKKSTRKPTARKATKKATKKTAKRAGGHATAKGLKVRMYRVGFGDFFLVTVPTSSGDQFILIDCGVFKGTSGKGDIGSIVAAVDDMFKTTKGKLSLVIMTHRHADHIAGFSKADFSKFEASLVWMPYWEKFNADKGKKSSAKSLTGDQNLTSDGENLSEQKDENEAFNLQLDIHTLAANLAMQFGSRTDDDAKEALAQLGNATGIDDFSAAAANGKKKTGGGNAAALDMLKNHLGENGKKVRYYAAGDEPELPDELVGLTATILGPPPQKARAFLALTDLKKGVGQYLDSMTDGDEGRKPIEPFPQEWTADLKRDYRPRDFRDQEIKYEEAVKAIESSQPDMLAAAAAKIETFLNNQSLVVLFEFGGKKLLFAGDAQAGNWEYWLFKMSEPIKDPTKAGDIVEESKELLQTIDFYKVGHHGSTNATPIQMVETATDRPAGSKSFVSMCSTEDDVYGNKAKSTEVPRTLLMDALAKGSCLVRSDAIAISVKDPAVSVAARKGVKLPTPDAGKITKTNLYIEYSF